MYVILGATGNTGSVVANKLLDSGKKVRVFGRDAARLSKFVQRGAEAATGEVTDAAALTEAFRGAEAVYAMLPPDMKSTDFRGYQDKATEAIAGALENTGVKNVVALSSIGADKKDRTGPVVGLHYLEERLGAIKGLNAVHVRAGYFMENTLAQIGIIQSFGMMAGPVRPDLALPMIATKDIGEFAANALLALNFQGQQTRELLGPRDVTYLDVAKIVGKAIGKPLLAYVQLPNEQVIQAMTGMGISRNVAKLLCELSDALNDGHLKALEARSEANRTPTTYEAFVQEVFLPAFSGKAANA